MGITYQEERLKDILPEFKTLLEPHMAEINVLYRDGEELNPDFNRYFKMQEAGVFLLMTCRKDGDLIGYISFFIMPHIRFMSCTMAYEDLYYLKPENRHGRTGYKLFTESEQLLKKRNVNRVVLSCKTFQDHSRLFDHLGYEFYEKHFTKSL
jgi:L-amino acid N-acyltransferase YncA